MLISRVVTSATFLSVFCFIFLSFNFIAPKSFSATILIAKRHHAIISLTELKKIHVGTIVYAVRDDQLVAKLTIKKIIKNIKALAVINIGNVKTGDDLYKDYEDLVNREAPESLLDIFKTQEDRLKEIAEQDRLYLEEEYQQRLRQEREDEIIIKPSKQQIAKEKKKEEDMLTVQTMYEPKNWAFYGELGVGVVDSEIGTLLSSSIAKITKHFIFRAYYEVQSFNYPFAAINLDSETTVATFLESTIHSVGASIIWPFATSFFLEGSAGVSYMSSSSNLVTDASSQVDFEWGLTGYHVGGSIGKTFKYETIILFVKAYAQIQMLSTIDATFSGTSQVSSVDSAINVMQAGVSLGVGLGF
ncbi:MAG: hypothetical protein ACI9QD_001009 [Thermoproteota archaeon]|jgi:hypothetical protein